MDRGDTRVRRLTGAHLASLGAIALLLTAACAPAAAPVAPAATSAPAAAAPTAAPAAKPTEAAKPAAPAAAAPTAAAVPTAAAAKPAPAKTLEKVTVRSDFGIGSYHAPYFVAAEKGWYAEEGLDVQFNEGSGSSTTVQVIASDRDTFGFATSDAVIRGAAQGAPVKMIANIFPNYGIGIMVRADSGIKGPKDMEGKTFGTPPGSAPTTLLPAYLTAAGVDPSKVKVITVDGSSLMQGYIGRQYDTAGVLCYGEPIQAKIQFGVESNCLMFSDVGVSLMGHGIIANNKTIQEKPEMVRAFLRATMKAFDYTFKNPEEAVAIMRKRAPDPAKLADDPTNIAKLVVMRQLTSTKETQGKPLGWMSDVLWKQTVETLQKYAELKEAPDPRSLFTNDFVPGV